MDGATCLFLVLIVAFCCALLGWAHEIGRREALERVLRARRERVS